MIPGKGRGNRPPPPPPPGYFGPPGTGPGSSSSYPAFVSGSSAIGTPPNQRVGFGGPPPPPPPLPHPLPLPLPLPPHQQQQQQQPQSPFAQSHPHPQFRNQPQHQHQHQLDQTRAPHLPHQHQQHQQHTPRLSHNQHSSKHSHSDLIVTPTQSSLPPSDPIDPALAFRPAVFTSVESLYDKTAMVGEGTYGKVYKAVNKKTKETVALKRVRIETEKEGFPITGVREIKILTSLRHDNVVRLLEIISEETGNACFVHLVFEYMDHDLTGIFNNAQLQWEQKHIKCLMKQLFEGLAYLHDKGIIHRDMKGSNLLLNNQGILKLADFGLARYMTVPKIEYTNRVITLWYRPPELLLGSTSYTTEIDLWSSGCIMAEMYIRRPLFPGNDEISQLDHIWKTCGVPTEESWPKVSEMPWWNFMRPSKQYPRVLGDNMQRHMIGEALTLLESLLQLDPILRPSAREVLQHLYFYEEPLPCMPYELPKVEGDWHEYESKLRKKGKHPEQVQDGHPGSAESISSVPVDIPPPVGLDSVADVVPPPTTLAALEDREYSSSYADLTVLDSLSSLNETPPTKPATSAAPSLRKIAIENSIAGPNSVASSLPPPPPPPPPFLEVPKQKLPPPPLPSSTTPFNRSASYPNPPPSTTRLSVEPRIASTSIVGRSEDSQRTTSIVGRADELRGRGEYSSREPQRRTSVSRSPPPFGSKRIFGAAAEQDRESRRRSISPLPSRRDVDSQGPYKSSSKAPPPPPPPISLSRGGASSLPPPPGAPAHKKRSRSASSASSRSSIASSSGTGSSRSSSSSRSRSRERAPPREGGGGRRTRNRSSTSRSRSRSRRRKSLSPPPPVRPRKNSPPPAVGASGPGGRRGSLSHRDWSPPPVQRQNERAQHNQQQYYSQQQQNRGAYRYQSQQQQQQRDRSPNRVGGGGYNNTTSQHYNRDRSRSPPPTNRQNNDYRGGDRRGHQSVDNRGGTRGNISPPPMPPSRRRDLSPPPRIPRDELQSQQQQYGGGRRGSLGGYNQPFHSNSHKRDRSPQGGYSRGNNGPNNYNRGYSPRRGNDWEQKSVSPRGGGGGGGRPDRRNYSPDLDRERNRVADGPPPPPPLLRDIESGRRSARRSVSPARSVSMDIDDAGDVGNPVVDARRVDPMVEDDVEEEVECGDVPYEPASSSEEPVVEGRVAQKSKRRGGKKFESTEEVYKSLVNDGYVRRSNRHSTAGNETGVVRLKRNNSDATIGRLDD